MTRLAAFPLLLATLIGCSQNGAPPDGGKPVAAKPSPEKEGLTWTHKEMLAHLKAKGLAVIMVPTSFGGEPMAMLGTLDKEAGVIVILKATPQAAAEMAGPWGATMFPWGRFLFIGDTSGTSTAPNLIPQIRAILSPPAN